MALKLTILKLEAVNCTLEPKRWIETVTRSKIYSYYIISNETINAHMKQSRSQPKLNDLQLLK
jgi:hypothetical protein